MKIFISAGDISGDIHAARLMKALRKLMPDIQFTGIGGPQMESEGLKSIIPISDISVVGFWEVIKRYGMFRRLLNKCKDIISSGNIDAFLPVDYPGFNLRLSGFAREKGVPVIYYIAPQLWAWGRNRGRKLPGKVDKLLVVFPFEVDFFRQYGIDATFVGHPLLDNPAFPAELPAFSAKEKKIAFLPGSRRQELAKHLPIVSSIGKELHKRLPDYELIIARPPSAEEAFYDQVLENTSIEFSHSADSRQLMINSAAGLVKTGTSTLEAALCGMPFVMFYRTSGLSYHLSKYLINLPYISLPNILADEKIVNEYYQNDIPPQKIAAEMEAMCSNESTYTDIIKRFSEIRKYLGNGGASHRAAVTVIDYLGHRNG